jgi:hypothetical protein
MNLKSRKLAGGTLRRPAGAFLADKAVLFYLDNGSLVKREAAQIQAWRIK